MFVFFLPQFPCEANLINPLVLDPTYWNQGQGGLLASKVQRPRFSSLTRKHFSYINIALTLPRHLFTPKVIPSTQILFYNSYVSEPMRDRTPSLDYCGIMLSQRFSGWKSDPCQLCTPGSGAHGHSWGRPRVATQSYAHTTFHKTDY